MKSKFINKKTFPYLLILPGVIFISVILIYPLVNGVISSFYHQAPMGLDRTFVGLENYQKLLTDKIFIRSFVNSLIYTSLVVVIEYIIGMLIALLLNEDFPGRGIYRSLILIPWVVPTVAAALSWKWIYDGQFGILNHILKSLGIIEENIAWLGSTELALPAIIATASWKGIPFVTVVLLAGLQSIPRELYESASIEGAGVFKRFIYITLPQLKGVSLITILLQCIWTFNQFDLVYIMTKGGPANSTQILPVYTYLNAFNFFEFNYAATIGTIGLIILGIFAFFYIRFTED